MEILTQKRPHIVMLPFTQQGHISPSIQLAKKLAERGANVTIVVSENTVLSGEGKTPNLQFVGVADNLPVERSKGSSFRDSVDSMMNMEVGFRDFLRRLQDEPAGVSALIYDAFMSWAPTIASSLSLPFICFFTSNATCCALMYQGPSLVERGIFPFLQGGWDENVRPPLSNDTIEGIDGVRDSLPEEFDKTHFQDRFIMKMAERLQDATAFILNTMEELEPEGIAAIRAHKPVYSVGPLPILSGCPSRLDVNYWPEDDHCLPWLDSHPPSSVLYVSFGSVASLPLPHFQQLALGLEASKQPFLWVVRPDSINASLECALPDGFLARTKDHGLIINWGPQLSILSHPSIGGFLTHGGWNSIIENLSTGSVPMICWPLEAEQQLNRRLMVDHLGLGLRLQHEEDESVAKEEIARVIEDLLQGERGKEVKKVASKVGDIAKRAVAKGGSSHSNFEALYNHIILHDDHHPSI